jgi:hypothetical protein
MGGRPGRMAAIRVIPVNPGELAQGHTSGYRGHDPTRAPLPRRQAAAYAGLGTCPAWSRNAWISVSL